MKMKKIFVIFLSAVFILVGFNLFAGKEDKEAPPAEEKVYKLGEIPSEQVTINCWQIAGGAVPWMSEFIKIYEKDHPNITFNMTVQSDEFMETSVISTFATKPDDLDFTFFWTGSRMAALAKDKTALNLDDWYDYYEWDKVLTPIEYEVNNFEGFGQSALSFGWIAYGVIFYNKDIFKKVGVTPPKTMDDWWKMCEKIKSSGYEVMAVAGKGGWPIELLHQGLVKLYLPLDEAKTYCEWLKIPNKTANDAEVYRSDGAIKSWQFIADMTKKGYFSPGHNSLEWVDENERFASGKAAMMAGFVSHTFVDARAQDPNFPLDYFILPGTSLRVEPMNVFTVPASIAEIKKPIVADFFNRWITDKDSLRLAIENGNNPTGTVLSPEEIIELSGEPLLGRFYEDKEEYPVLLCADGWISLPMCEEYFNDLQEVTEGTITPEEAGQRMYELALESLEE